MAITKTLILLLAVVTMFVAGATSVHDKRKRLEKKYTHIRLYVQIINPTAPKVVHGPNNNPIGFGDIVMIDNPLTEGIDISSKVLGREQGYTIGVSRDPDFSKTINFITLSLAFTEGEHNGSAITVMGRDPIFNVARELQVVGGIGAFRLARGYSIWTILSFNLTGNSVIQGDIHVFHY